MARGDFVDAGYSSMDSPRTGCKAGFWWRYANTSQEAINTNSDIIEIFPYITRTTTNYSPYSNNNYYSRIDVYIYNSSSTFDIYSQSWQNRYNYGNVSANTKYGLTSTYNSSNPFGYTAGTSTTRITTTTKDGKTIYGTRFTVQHNADGTAPRVVLNLILGLSDTHGGSITHSIEPSLDTIPRASQPTCAGTTLGVSTRINTNRVSNSFTHTLNIKIGSTTIETFTGIGDYKDWTPAISTYLQYISSTSGTITIECITYSNGSEIGRATTTCVLTVPNNVDTKPTASVSISEGTSGVIPSGWNVYVKGKSKLAVSITGTPKAGTSIASYYSTANGSAYSSNSYTTSELTGSGTVTANVTDGRGFTSNNATASYTVQDYTNPQITTNTVARCNSSGTLTDDGTYVKWSFQGSISSVSNKNAKTFTLKYKEKNAGSYTTIYTYNSGYTLPNDATTIDVISGGGNIDITKEYIFRFEATDSFTTTAKEVEIGTVADLMNFNASGKSMAIGGVSQRGATEEALDVYLPAQFRNDVIVDEIRSKNIFDVRGIEQTTNNGITCTYDNSTNIITLNGTASSNANFAILSAIGMKFKKSVKYTTSIFYISGTTTGSLKLFAQDVNYNYEGIQMEFSGSSSKLTQQFNNNLTVTPGFCLIRVYGGRVLNNLKFKIQVEEGSNTTSYMPYQELNPDNFKNQEIVVGSIKSKNMCDIYTSQLEASISSTDGTIISAQNNACGTNYISAKPNTTYIISTNTNLSAIRLSEYTSQKAHIQRTAQNNVRSLTITTSANTYYLRWSININDATTTIAKIEAINLQLEEGSIPTGYRPHQNLDGMETYSTTETVIGTFLGKPLYRKVFTGTFAGGTNTVVYNALPLTNTVRNIYGTSIQPQNFNRRTLPYIIMGGGLTYYISIMTTPDASGINLAFFYSQEYNTHSYEVVIEYTKTTD